MDISVNQLKQKAIDEVFARNPNLEKCYGTIDGNLFEPSALNAAQLHARQSKLELYTIINESYAAQEAIELAPDADPLAIIDTSVPADVSAEVPAEEHKSNKTKK
ncbi:hypothetical protein SAMN05421780_101547 [Flexibacter flexilis DSM 6793]|uniref:Uncharacterized protein n=1 Tax=Flexibacter flexilis DSM 6793 TaxID=927664 RepID=A0A1I1DZP4_9BACT|nr:hypothetical protein [Flexibacter flexilis]SFB80294.1 hypothetical protein SAMN05421780_101547 [Flexibacter flexilis DSM 6793]